MVDSGRKRLLRLQWSNNNKDKNKNKNKNTDNKVLRGLIE